MAAREQGRRALAISISLAFVVLAALVAAMDSEKVLAVMHGAHWRALVPALLFTAVSYACLTQGYAAINRMFGIRLSGRDQLEVGFVSFALNNLISAGGAAGYSLRTVLLRRRGYALEDILGASLVHSYFNHLVMMSLLPVGLVYLLVNHPLGRSRTAELCVAAAGALLLLAGLTVLLVRAAARRRVAAHAGRLGRRVLRRDFEPALRNLDATLERGIAAVRVRPGTLTLPLLLVLADWATCVAALGFCFRAVDTPVHPGVLVTGFAIGVTLGFLSMIPGGMGVQEGSMTGVYVMLGVAFEKAVLAAVLFRAVYYIVPFLFSLILYARALKRVATAQPARD
jgi:uncharacterized protein (TIRG00374 family)